MSQPVIPYYRPRRIPLQPFYDKVEAVFDARWFSNGGKCELDLEEALAQKHGVAHCILVANATIGIQLVAQALELKGEVITTGFSFIATAHALAWLGLKPVFCDIDPHTLTIDAALVKQHITAKTSAILGVHVFGQPCDVAALDQVGTAASVPVFYDAAHCFGVQVGGQSIGRFGSAEILSLHATKLFHTFEGGAILTDDPGVARRLRMIRNFGFGGMDQVSCLGTNAKMHEISASYGLAMLPHVPETVQRLAAIQARYRDQLAGFTGLSLFQLTPQVTSNYQYCVALIDPVAMGRSRDEVWLQLWQAGIQTRRYFYPGLHQCEPYRSQPGPVPHLPHTEDIVQRVLCLPCYYDLQDAEIDVICASIRTLASTGEVVKLAG